MPDANGAFKGTGWSRTYDDAWERIFGNAASQRPSEPEPPELRALRNFRDSLLRCGDLPERTFQNPFAAAPQPGPLTFPWPPSKPVPDLMAALEAVVPREPTPDDGDFA